MFSRSGDVMLALPQLLISIGIVAACTSTKSGCLNGLIQPGMTLVIAIIVLFSWPYIARLVRGYTLSIREKEFVEASRSLGAGNFRIITREILPNLIGPMIVYTTLLIPQSILFEAALSYLGLGVPPNVASWGGLLNQASALLRRGLVADPVPGPRSRADHACVQPAGRRPARRARRKGRPVRNY